MLSALHLYNHTMINLAIFLPFPWTERFLGPGRRETLKTGLHNDGPLILIIFVLCLTLFLCENPKTTDSS